MKQYLDLVSHVINNGTKQANRTGVNTISFPGAMLRFDLQEGFPAITTRKMAFKSAIGEMCGFLRGVNNAAEFRALGCKVWDQNANENAQWLANPFRQGEDDLGEIYGVQWRKWPAYKQILLSNTAAIEQTLSNGYKQIAQGEEDGQAYVVLYKAIDQVRQCVDTIIMIRAAGASCSTAGTAPSSMKWPCRRAICCTSSTRMSRPRKFL